MYLAVHFYSLRKPPREIITYNRNAYMLNTKYAKILALK